MVPYELRLTTLGEMTKRLLEKRIQSLPSGGGLTLTSVLGCLSGPGKGRHCP
jgi:hypothetical protein